MQSTSTFPFHFHFHVLDARALENFIRKMSQYFDEKTLLDELAFALAQGIKKLIIDNKSSNESCDDYSKMKRMV